MSIQELISHLRECRRHLAELRLRADYLPLHCAMLRLEGEGGLILRNDLFASLLRDRVFWPRISVAIHDNPFIMAFYPSTNDPTTNRLNAAQAAVESVTKEIKWLLSDLPHATREYLVLPPGEDWWRVVFHLAWHFSYPFLRANRERLLTEDGDRFQRVDETMVQLIGSGGRRDLLPGLIYSELEHDLCICSEAAVGVILDKLEQHAQLESATLLKKQLLSSEDRRAFDCLRAEFLASTQLPPGSIEGKLLKLADSFVSPPAREWASLQIGASGERFLTLSRLNDLQEIVQIRGAATNWFCEVAERAGRALPACVPDSPILFEDIQRGFRGPRPVMNREPLERWLGFVFATLKQHRQEALRIWWGTQRGPLSYGLATLDRDLCAASVLAIDLARLTTAAKEAADRECASCSPFSVPSMEEQGFQWAEPTPPLSSPPENYTLGQMIVDLRQFGESYHQSAEHIGHENSAVQRGARVQLGAFVSQARDNFQRVPGFTELRELVRSLWNKEISFAVGRRIVDAIVRGSNGHLSARDVEGLKLVEAASKLTAVHEGNELPIPIEVASSQADEMPAEVALPQQAVEVQLPAPQPGAEPLRDAPFAGDGFRYQGKEVRFGRAAKQQALVLALWDIKKCRPRAKRKIEDVLTEVYGHDHCTTDAAFRQLCSDTQRRLDAVNLALKITSVQGKVCLEPRPL